MQSHFFSVDFLLFFSLFLFINFILNGVVFSALTSRVKITGGCLFEEREEGDVTALIFFYDYKRKGRKKKTERC